MTSALEAAGQPAGDEYARRVSAALDAMIESVFDWEAKVDAFTATGSDDDDIAVTHDSRGRMIELSIRPGLQEELTAGELEDAVNDEIARNAQRAADGLAALANEFFGQFTDIPEEMAKHETAEEFSAALNSARQQRQRN